MPIPIRLEKEQTIRSVLEEWARHIEHALRSHFPALSVSHHPEQGAELVLFLSEGGTARGEIVLRWDRSAPNEIGIYPRRPALAAVESRATGDTLALRVAAACVIAATALWLGAAIGFWNDFLDRDLRGKALVLVVGFSAWILTTFGLAAAAYYIVRRSHRAIETPRAERGRQWLDTELWPWLQGALDELQQRARADEGLARRLAV